ncbi:MULTISPECIES: cysteine desulfurase family protein [Prochlorococcus]|uniref:cysteine desulfurase family protein n=1 Tax=Prochlorococcus TaxID=1218 RepID=UPI000533B0EC|nr:MULTISPECIES: aminotransferase class V-fold PLP-dependent enzyme [Prochlorococcus]KGG12467.1 Cysteine desulfurase [Prochlorococcus sp. MIT 0601]
MKSNTHLYLDACASTPPLKSVVREVSRIQSLFWGNPLSLHNYGLRSSEIIERSRNKIATLMNIRSEQVVFTSGATESIKLALNNNYQNLTPGRIVISAVEHPSVYLAANYLKSIGWDVAIWPVDNKGILKLNCLEELLSHPTKIVSIIWAQSEIGSIQPVSIISRECMERGITFHSDATQLISQGLLPLDQLDFDYISLSAHKLQGPLGIGMLILGPKITDKFSIYSGDNEFAIAFKSGTPAVPLIAGMAKALSCMSSKIKLINDETIIEESTTSKLTKELRNLLRDFDFLRFTGHPEKRLPHHLSYIVTNDSCKPILGRDLVRELSKRRVYVSSGTACKSGTTLDSNVLEAISVNKPFRQSGLRISLGPWISNDDINLVPSILKDAIQSLRNL